MLWREFFFFPICMGWRSARMHAHKVLEGLSTARLTPRCHSFPMLHEFSLPSWTLEDPKKQKNKKQTCALCTLQISAAIVWGGPGLLSQQRTTHHFLLSSLLLGLITESKHSGSMILLVSQGRLFIQFSPQHWTEASSYSVRRKRKRGKWEVMLTAHSYHRYLKPCSVSSKHYQDLC